MKRTLLVMAVMGAATLQAPRAAEAQLANNHSATCVTGIGCSQVDFFVDLLEGTPATIDYFWIALTAPGWSFSTPFWGGEVEDANGYPFFDPVVVQSDYISGNFLFGAVLDPSLRFRAEMDTYGADIQGMTFDCEGGANGTVVFRCGDRMDSGVVPEPATMILLGTGLIGVFAIGRRRRNGLQLDSRA